MLQRWLLRGLKALELFFSLGMRLLYMAAEDHDVHAAYVSHISHVTSFALALTVLDKDERHIFDGAPGEEQSWHVDACACHEQG